MLTIPQDRHLLIYLTNQCNLNCRHCLLRASPQGSQKLSWLQIKKILSYYKDQDFSGVSFSGGEAIISPHLSKAIKYAQKIGYKAIAVNTNGFNQSIFKKISTSEVDIVNFSIDGATSKTHDYIRGKDTFNACLNSIRKSIQLGFYTRVIVTINQKNYREVIDITKLLDGMKVNRISFSYLTLRGNAKENAHLFITPRQWHKVYQKIVDYKDLNFSEVRIPPLFLTKKEVAKLDHSKDYPCLLRKASRVEVLPDGQIFNCCLLSDDPYYSCGKVNKDDLTINRKHELKLLERYPESFCPVQEFQLSQLNNHNPNRLIPVCLYHRTVISPKKNKVV